jgi:hypothetical protein
MSVRPYVRSTGPCHASPQIPEVDNLSRPAAYVDGKVVPVPN